MEVTRAIKTMIINRDKKNIDVANAIGYTKQGFSNLLRKNNYKIEDLIKIANILNYDVEIKLKDRAGKDDITISN